MSDLKGESLEEDYAGRGEVAARVLGETAWRTEGFLQALLC